MFQIHFLRYSNFSAEELMIFPNSVASLQKENYPHSEKDRVKRNQVYTISIW